MVRELGCVPSEFVKGLRRGEPRSTFGVCWIGTAKCGFGEFEIYRHSIYSRYYIIICDTWFVFPSMKKLLGFLAEKGCTYEEKKVGRRG